MHERPAPLPPADLALRSSAYMIDGMIVGFAKLLLRATGAPWLVGFALIAFYYTWMPLAYSGQSFGKMAAGIAIVDAKGKNLTLGQCLGRFFAFLLSTLLLGAGFLVAFFSPQRRALHDHIADTRVVTVESLGATRRRIVLIAGLGAFGVSFLLLLAGGLAALLSR